MKKHHSSDTRLLLKGTTPRFQIDNVNKEDDIVKSQTTITNSSHDVYESDFDSSASMNSSELKDEVPGEMTSDDI